jgi:hypothetical protein
VARYFHFNNEFPYECFTVANPVLKTEYLFLIVCFVLKKEEDDLAWFTLEGMSGMEISASLNFGDPCF